ncbi:aspartate carbamoyltransferase catalytic subunit [Scopulibacillus daqui]|uniref:Aspartate carbamoyltransferase n=1 Tax=Scopulibacillus daqui TaxID=1469162 RepID=A0ABS2PW73_9BACL|nr:aspartate carbamoyltransferase catalytic subunit [Scopulibacillus daqui]MBM7644292.1 aspartate carbamoyltransferase catalytic subunit [Scopulibacillus daqui]
MPHLLTLSDLSIGTINDILNRAQEIQIQNLYCIQQDIICANLFFEASTRTRFSFEAAEKRLGYHVLNFSDESSSTQKGESLYDTLRTLEEIGVKAAVIRHRQDKYYEDLRGRLSLSIINGGDGCSDHPTQALLDLMTIKQEFSSFKDLTVAIIGDLRHSRVARSDAEVLTRLGAKVLLSGPKEWMNSELPGEYVGIDEAVKTADIVMMLRIQHERHTDGMDLSKEAYHKQYGLTLERERLMKPGSIIMHPAPVNRGVEIADELVEAKRSRIFRQINNGVAVRMAVLEWAVNQTEEAKRHEYTANKR